MNLQFENKKLTVKDLFVSWSEELGYSKAVLLSCAYPVKMVLEMTEEDAEAEIQAIAD